MPVQNSEIAAVFDQIADLLELQDANPFRIRAYRRAARVLEGQSRPVAAMLERGESLEAMPGIGADLAAKIAEIVASGRCTLLDRLRTEMPAGLDALLQLPQLGAKRVRALHEELGVQNLEQLHRAAQAGRVSALHGFGRALEQRILQAAGERLAHVRRVRVDLAQAAAQVLLDHLRALPGVERAEAAGSLRRRRESVGDLDLLVQAADGRAVIDAFTNHEDVREVMGAGSTRASVRLRAGLQVDLRVVASPSFGAAWVYFTGSKAHNIALRKIARQQGLKINEYGVFRGPRAVAGADEASVYAAVGLPWIAPELREDAGEFEAARAASLPRLVELADLRGDLHVHTSDSDGRDDLDALVAAARDRGLQYLAVTDHSARQAVTHGLDAARLARQLERIDRLNERLRGFTLLKGIEVDILRDGRLALPDAVLGRLDLVVAAIHDGFDLPQARQTERILRAMDRPHFSILAHPTGRMIEERAPMAIDLPRVLRHAHERGCFVELNSQCARLDLDGAGCRLAKAEGVQVSIASDAHGAFDLANLHHGIGQARRGWLEKADVLNCRPLARLRPLLARTM